MPQIFSNFLPSLELLFNTKLLTLQTDGGGEFKLLTQICQKLGIIHRLSCPHTKKRKKKKKRGLVERKHRHIVETGLALLAHSSLPFSYWADAFETTVYLINLLP